VGKEKGEGKEGKAKWEKGEGEEREKVWEGKWELGTRRE
jgi:hypothetical protein